MSDTAPVPANSSLARTFRAQVRTKVGVPASNLLPSREPRFGDVVVQFPKGADLAEELGYGTARDNPRGSPGYRRRQTLLDNYSRWRRGARNPWNKGGGSRAYRPRLEVAVRRRWALLATPASELDVLRMIDEHGATVLSFRGKFRYQPNRERKIYAHVYVDPETLEDAAYSASIRSAPPIDWDWTARAFMNGWIDAYGLDDEFQEEIDDKGSVVSELEFNIGRDEEGVDYPAI